MKFMSKMERRFGKYSIKNLPLIMILMEAIGYTISMVSPDLLNYLCFDAASILRGQVWRLITWVLMPPTSLNIFTVIMLFFYYWIARTLANTWGDFYFNVYMFGGILITDIGMLIAYPILDHFDTAWLINVGMMGSFVTLYYIQTTILLAFAFTYPNAQVLLYFIIPIKMSWLGIFEGIMLAYDFIRSSFATPRLVILLALLNLVIYFLLTKDLSRYHPKEFARRANYRRATGQNQGRSGFGGFGSRQSSQGSNSGRQGPGGDDSFGRQGSGNASTNRRSAANYTKIYPNGAHHKCTICGRTELDDENLEFRYCSKCEGNHEYCQDHLFTHQHIKNGVPGGQQ